MISYTVPASGSSENTALKEMPSLVLPPEVLVSFLVTFPSVMVTLTSYPSTLLAKLLPANDNVPTVTGDLTLKSQTLPWSSIQNSFPSFAAVL
ncbi:hypothetical protein D3C87_1896620 [compost metagenome]